MSKVLLLRFVPGLLLVALLSAPPRPVSRQGGGPLLPRPGLLQALFKSQQGLVTDYFWILMLNRIGTAVRPDEYRDVYDYGELVTDLDPRFRQPYLYGGITIPVHLGKGQYANVAESSALLRKGLKALPDNERLAFQLAYNLMFFEQRYKEAADIIQELARRPDAPPWYLALATRLYAQSGDFDSSLSISMALRDGSEDPETRQFYEQRVREILQERTLRAVDAAIAKYRTREGRLPDSLAQLVSKGDLPQLPQDPMGGKLFLGEDGRAYSDAVRFRMELIHDEKSEEGERLVPKPREPQHDDAQP
ncbi:tetratricopeptide repeat protein [Corallococcus carmarthensis]|uniref:Pilus assembly protein PilG n=1 Tax=Corallococcus carmarthensis TaxID=2316728 RepID=A0A3A8K5X9_9BACT|nr:pilus assembly protein PilG [Corallococcus carmarthensis]NOK18048.1 pilus assembly protein PilG [Corallococcus carmarthensis]RKH03563.1 pilus assembly protein PilG [Corallococcus carmarthensis]